MISSKCRVGDCDEPVFGAVHVSIWKKNKKGKTITDINRNPILEGYDLWYYCELHYEIYSMIDQKFQKIERALDNFIEKKIQEKSESINALFRVPTEGRENELD